MAQISLQRLVSRGMFKKNTPFGLKRIFVSGKEHCYGKLTQRNLQVGLAEFHKNGFLILENAIGHKYIDHIRERMLKDFPKNLGSPTVHYNHGKNAGNISQTPPLLSEYLHGAVWANCFAVQLMEHIIGPKPQLSFATSNIVLPGTKDRQAVHSDYYCNHFNFPVFLEVCIFLDDTDSSNGSTEIWPGTHRGFSKKDHSSKETGWIKQEVFNARAVDIPPFQPKILKGSLCIRDLRLWHAARENSTNIPRIMLGFLYSPKWFRSLMRMRFHVEAKKRLESWDNIDCLSATEFVDGEFDYLNFVQQLNLTQISPEAGSKYQPKHGTVTVMPEHYWSPPSNKVSLSVGSLELNKPLSILQREESISI
jgi:Phytanoyl-CoA dioxygenase (PhyH)